MSTIAIQCASCAQPFEAERTTRRTCSNACRAKLARGRDTTRHRRLVELLILQRIEADLRASSTPSLDRKATLADSTPDAVTGVILDGTAYTTTTFDDGREYTGGPPDPIPFLVEEDLAVKS